MKYQMRIESNAVKSIESVLSLTKQDLFFCISAIFNYGHSVLTHTYLAAALIFIAIRICL